MLAQYELLGTYKPDYRCKLLFTYAVRLLACSHSMSCWEQAKIHDGGVAKGSKASIPSEGHYTE